MINNCRSCLTLFNNNWIKEGTGIIAFAERNPAGRGEAIFECGGPCIVIKAHHQAPLIWALAQRKCADGAFISFVNGQAHLHIVELKSTITVAEWAKVVEQFEGMFLTSLAITRLLQIDKLSGVTCYIAGTTDRITSRRNTASPTLLKAPVGEARTFGRWESWDKGVVSLPLSFEAALVKGWKDGTGVANFGSV